MIKLDEIIMIEAYKLFNKGSICYYLLATLIAKSNLNIANVC